MKITQYRGVSRKRLNRFLIRVLKFEIFGHFSPFSVILQVRWPDSSRKLKFKKIAARNLEMILDEFLESR